MDDVVLRPVAGVVARDPAGRVLLVRRRDDGTWGLPGGGVEAGETWAQAAVRECREESGWDVRVDGLLGVYSDPATQVHRYPDGAQRHFVGVVVTAVAVRRAGAPDDEVTEVGFFALDGLPAPLFAPDAPVLADVVSGRAGPHLR